MYDAAKATGRAGSAPDPLWGRESERATVSAPITGKGGAAMPDTSVYKFIEIVGTSTVSWEEAAKMAVETAGKKLDDLRVAEIVELDMRVQDNKVVAYRAKVKLSFKYHGHED